MDSQDIRAQDGVLPQGMRALPAGLWLLIIPNLWLFLAFRGEGGGVDLAQPVAPLEAMRWLAYGVGWVLLNLLVLRMGGRMERHLLHPLRQIIAAMEAVRCLEEGVLRAPIDADVGAILGWGFPAYLGGPIGQIHSRGIAAFVADCDELARRHGPRFEPPKSLRAMAAEGKTFFAR